MSKIEQQVEDMFISQFLFEWLKLNTYRIYTSLVYSLGRCRKHFPCLAPICRALILKNDSFEKVRFFPNMAFLSKYIRISVLVKFQGLSSQKKRM